MDRAGLNKVKISMQAVRGWATRCAPWVGLVGLLGAAQEALAGDYEGSPQVAEFVGEMTRDYGFAGEQLMGVFREASASSRFSTPSRARPSGSSSGRNIARCSSPMRALPAVWTSGASTRRCWPVPSRNTACRRSHCVDHRRRDLFRTQYRQLPGDRCLVDPGLRLSSRAEFFRKELREFLLLAREEQVDPLTLKGSYAGAMGLPQFMPSSFRAYAVDFDGDGHINIWTNPDDAIGSVASYFKRHGWVAGEGGQPRRRGGERVDEGLTTGIEPTKTVGELRALGWSVMMRCAMICRLPRSASKATTALNTGWA
jgi:membrane-bound lytic murein transglycosylase B